ncbi:conserved hypothetical protein [Ixodes scapularis]|uniref:Secreted protein n=1 Tax=Ixodes scapularis TaxID=6945 RepID=B7QI30_IXOSC|nr:conserved hypothetical protein [Ixodes scapularis]|eukprot:XP_002414837.1 conserved hypothetical protein [Ixodes scapularis]
MKFTFWCSFWHWPWCLLEEATAVTVVITEGTVVEATVMGAATEDTDTEDLSDTEDITATTEATVTEEDTAKGATATDMEDTEVIAVMADTAGMVTMGTTGGREKTFELPKQASFPVPRNTSSAKDEICLRLFSSFSSSIK